MKKSIFLSVSLVLMSLISTAQTNTFPTAGNVGIGTMDPTGARLDVLANSGQTESLARFKIYDAPGDYFQITNSTGNVNQFIPLVKGHHQSDNRISIAIMGSTSDAMDNGTHALVNFDARRPTGPIQNRPLFSWTSYTTKMMTMTANGNLGIGTTNPQEKFQISNSYTFHDGGHKVMGFLYKPSGNVDLDSSKYAGEIRFDPTNGILRIGTSSSITNAPITSLYIDKNGDVGIGIANTKGYKLGVKGKIAAEEVKVALYNTWPDYVFESNYNLQTLEEVENHIIEKGHLQNIPSAKEVEENGIQLGEMNARLLQKIEELTLYLIEQNKKTEQLQKEVALLKKKIK